METVYPLLEIKDMESIMLTQHNLGQKDTLLTVVIYISGGMKLGWEYITHKDPL